MKLLDRMKDEELGQALLYNFTKAYGSVPMGLYDVVLPLLYMDEIRESLNEYTTIEQCIQANVQKNPLLSEKFDEYYERYEGITSKALAVGMLQHHLAFNVVNNVMCGEALEAAFLDLNEAILLAEMMQDKTKEDIISYFKSEPMKIVVLQTDTLGKDIDLAEFENLGNVSMYPVVNQDQVVDLIQDADIVVTNKNILTEKELAGLDKLKLIALTATGYNNVDVEYCKRKGIKVANVTGYSTDTVAQHTLSLALHLIEKNHLYDEYVKSSQYSQSGMFSYFDYHFHDISSMTWGIVGLGNIGRKVAEIVTAMGANVQYYSTSGKNSNHDYKQVDFDTLLATSDIISIHAPLNDATYHLFNKESMSKMKSDSYLINVGRGPIVDEKALVDLLNQGWFDGVGLDVFEVEPLPTNSALFDIKDKDKVILTPHVAWGSVEARQRLVHEVCLNIKEFMQGKERNIVNK
ncbi:MAG: D-2-hydroxyacid dehydrogenase [Bacilli bacterium]|nr:D-2-hydroxyacid dehydrogenase [Bacilli bacterium]